MTRPIATVKALIERTVKALLNKVNPLAVKVELAMTVKEIL